MRDENVERRYQVRASGGEAGARLDRLLSEAVTDISRTRLKKLIESGRVKAAGETITDPSYRVKPGQTFEITVPESAPVVPAPHEMALEILYEDADLVVINKPPGLVVHPAPGNPDKTLVNALLAHCGDSLSSIGGVCRPGIVHRLDKDTSGLMVAAKNDEAHASLAAQFETRNLERAYLAVVWGVPSPLRGEITGNIGRSPRNRKKMAVLRRGGKPAVTQYRVIRILGKPDHPAASLVECRLKSGRTHQIRVHMSAKGHPLLGDRTYGRKAPRRRRDARVKAALAGLKRQALHAYLIGFEHPKTGKRLLFEIQLPLDMNELVHNLDHI